MISNSHLVVFKTYKGKHPMNYMNAIIYEYNKWIKYEYMNYIT